MTVKALERKQYETALDNKSYDLYLGEIRLTADFNLSTLLKSFRNTQFSTVSTNGLLALCESSLANSGSYTELCRRLLESAPICPVVFKSYAVYVTRGEISNNAPGLELVFHDRSQERALSDAYQTNREEESTT